MSVKAEDHQSYQQHDRRKHYQCDKRENYIHGPLHLPEILPVMHIALFQYFLNERLLGRIFYFFFRYVRHFMS